MTKKPCWVVLTIETREKTKRFPEAVASVELAHLFFAFGIGTAAIVMLLTAANGVWSKIVRVTGAW